MNSNKNFRVYRNIDKIEGCKDCNWKRFCGGECPGGIVISGKMIEEKPQYCEYYKTMFTYMAKKIPLIHTNGLIREILE